MRKRIVGSLLWFISVSASPALAQTPARLPGDEGVVLQWVIAFGLMVVIAVSAFLNPKRSHLN